MKKIYISGKMGNLPELEIQNRFYEAERHIRTEYEQRPVNPASYAIQGYFKQAGFSYTQMLLEDIKLLSTCQGIYMLRGWEESPGATAEHAFAKAIGLEITYEQ